MLPSLCWRRWSQGRSLRERSQKDGLEHLNCLNAYMSVSPSARYAILTSGTNTKIYRRDLEYPRALQEIGNLPKYESARSAAEHSPFKVILNPSKPDGIQMIFLAKVSTIFAKPIFSLIQVSWSTLSQFEGKKF